MPQTPENQHAVVSCVQGPTIEAIQATLGQFQGIMGRVAEALEKVAEGGIRIGHVEDDMRRQDKINTELFSQLREVTMLVGKDGSGVKLEILEAIESVRAQHVTAVKELSEQHTKAIKELTTSLAPTIKFVDVVRSKPAIVAISVIAVLVVIGFVNDMAYHKGLTMEVWKLFK